MTQTRPADDQLSRINIERLYTHVSQHQIERIIQIISRWELPGKEYAERYLQQKWRLNHRPGSFMGSLKSIELFLALYASRGKSLLEDTTRDDLEAFVESEQDRGLKITSVRARLKYLFGFLRFLVEQEVVPERMLGLKIRIKIPDMLPRAMNPDDVRKLFSVIDHTRDRALILMLLRTGMRIGEALALIMNDIDIAERKVYIFEGKKSGLGRVVYLSDDAVFALKRWFARRDEKKVAVFYGRGHQTLAYSSARALFTKYIGKARLEHKGYTIHSLRHTFASELLSTRVCGWNVCSSF